MLIAWCNAPGEHALALILQQLIVRIWNLKPVSRREEVQMKDVFAAGLVIKMIEDGLIVSYVMKRRKFGSI